MNIIDKSLLSIGECMVELSPDGMGKLDLGFAGDTFNTVWYMRQLLPPSFEISYLSAVGDGELSDQMIAFIDDAGILTDRISRIEGLNVGLYMIHTHKGERRFSYWRENSAARKLAVDIDHLNAAMDGFGLVFFSSITIAILAPNDRQNLYEALTLARGNGSKIIFDPNLRPALWQNNQTMCEEVIRFAECANIVLPSYDDEAQYFGDESPNETLARYLAYGAELVVVKNGANKIFAGGASQPIIEFTPERLDNPVDTTAAGDGFNAGFLSEFIKTDNFELAIGAGAELSAKVIGKRGALVSLN